MIRINLARDRQPPASPISSVPGRRLPRLLVILAIAGVHLFQSASVASLERSRDRLRSDLTLRQAARGVRATAGRQPLPAERPQGNAAASARRLRHLAASVPHDLWVVAYRERGGEITIEGRTRSDAAVRTLTGELSNMETFGPVEITETVRDEERDSPQFSFTLVALVRRKSAASGSSPVED